MIKLVKYVVLLEFLSACSKKEMVLLEELHMNQKIHDIGPPSWKESFCENRFTAKRLMVVEGADVELGALF